MTPRPVTPQPVTPPPLPLRRAVAAPAVRIVHLGLGAFFRAHQAWYTARASDAAEWGIAAFSGRSAHLADALAAQEGLYTLVTRGPDEDSFELIGSVARAYPAADVQAWLDCLADPALAVVTCTVTEAGYTADITEDLAALRAGRPDGARTAVGRLVAGLAARRTVGAGPLALVPCDNVPSNGTVLFAAVTELADRLDPALRHWIEESVHPVATMVDRITPKAADDDRRVVAAALGLDDHVPVVTEPYAEWALAGTFPAGRPLWEDAGAQLVDDVAPFEQRKLWLLNGGHSMLAYVASLRGARTVAEAMRDERARGWLEAWWEEAAAHLSQSPTELAAYRDALTVRFTNARIAHRLSQIAEDGSQKVRVRVLPTLRAERAAGREGAASAMLLAAWLCHLKGMGAPVRDVEQDTLVPLVAPPWPVAARRLLDWLGPDLGGDATLVARVAERAEQLGAVAGTM